MELREYFQTLWKWRWLIILCTLCAGLASFIVSGIMPPVYEARVMLMSNQLQNTGIVDYSSLLGGQQVIQTYRELLQTRPVLETVITGLGLPYSPQELTRRIEVNIIPETQLLELRVEDNDAQRAADIANEIVLTFLLQRSTEQQLQELETRKQALIMQMSALEQAIERAKTELEQLRASPGLLTQEELTSLQAQQSQQRATYASLLAGYLDLQAMESRSLDVVVVESAQPASEPIHPRKVLNTAVAAVGGFTIACVLAFFLEYLNDTLEDADDVHEMFSLPNLGTIPFVKSWQKDGYARAQKEEWPIAEAFRLLRTNIRFANVDNIARTLLVTSSEPREGKTSVVTNLGIVMAQDGYTTLLVDTDFRRSELHRVFDVPNQTGLTSLLLDDTDLERFIFETDVPNLYVLPRGPLPPNPSELLGSRRMAQLTKELEAFADIVLFDVPPVLACADALVLASQVDGTILVIESRSTRRRAAMQALEMLRNVGAEVLGVVLNRVQGRSFGYYHYSDYREYH
jgi:non-specific protein-tyrosine kinase